MPSDTNHFATATKIFHKKLKSLKPINYDFTVAEAINIMEKTDKPFNYVENYNPRKFERNLIKPTEHSVPKTKRESFVVTLARKTENNPGLGKYNPEKYF